MGPLGIIVIGCIVISAIALPTLYITSHKAKGTLQATYALLGIERVRSALWNRSDFNDTLIGSDALGMTLNIKHAATLKDIDTMKNRMCSRIKSGWGKRLNERAVDLQAEGIGWSAILVTYENDGPRSAVLVYTGMEGHYVAAYCDKVLVPDIEPLLPQILTCYKKK